MYPRVMLVESPNSVCMYVASIFMSVLVLLLLMKQKGRGLEHNSSLE